MYTFLLRTLAALALIALWGAANVASLKQGWFLHAIAPKHDSAAFMAQSTARLQKEFKGNYAYMLIDQGQVFAEQYDSKGKPVDSKTLFGLSSLSKWVTSYGVMVLVERGDLELDKPVSNYLTRWQLPETAYDNEGVTVRRLLSHTAGLTDGLGHDGFAPGTPIQPLTDHLTQALDADPGVSGRVEVGIEPGTQFKYSGGSYNLLQLIVEEVSGESFSEFMTAEVFTPLGMNHTSYNVANDHPSLARYHDGLGGNKIYPQYTSLAATGLYSNLEDLAKFLAAHYSQKGASVNANQLTQESLILMRQPIAETFGIDIWGAGPMLFADNGEGDFIIGHGGQSPMLNTTARVNPATGNGLIVLSTGNRSMASDLATQWTVWESGKPDMYILKNNIPKMIKRVLMGSLVIVFMFVIWGLRRKIKSVFVKS